MKGVGIADAISKIDSMIGKNRTIGLSSSLGKICNENGTATTEINYGVTVDAEGFKCELSLPVTAFLDDDKKNSIKFTISIGVILKKDGPINQAKATAEQMADFAKEHSIILGIVCLAGVIVAVIASGVISSVVATIIAAAAELLVMIKAILTLLPAGV